MELRLTGASSVVPEQAQQITEAIHGKDHDTNRNEQKVRSSIPALHVSVWKKKRCNPDTQGWRLHVRFISQTDFDLLMPCRIAQG